MTIWEIKDELGLKPISINTNYVPDGTTYKPTSKELFYQGVLSTGDFDGLGDYNTGLLQVTIRPVSDLTFSIIIITTIADGIWEGFGKEEVDIDLLYKDFVKEFGIKLPTEKRLNEFLSKYGIHGTYTG